MPKFDLSNVKPSGISFYACTTCESNSDGRPFNKMVEHTKHDGPMVVLTPDQIEQWWLVRDLYSGVREWYNNQ